MNRMFRDRLLRGERLVGPIITLASTEVSEIMTRAGYDWLFVDAEHSPLSTSAIQAILQGAGPETPCLIRLASGDEVSIKKALDIGAAGIIVPQVNSAEHAAKVVSWARYAPEGTRGIGLARAHGYGLAFQEYLTSANEGVSVVVQAEHVDAVANIEAIVRVPGVDAVLVGPYDLSASMGIPGRVEDPEVQAAIEKVTQACLEAGKPLGIFGVSAAAVRPYIDRGYTLIVAGVDTLLLGQAAAGLVAELKS